MHINPPAETAGRIVFIDLENQHQAISFNPRTEDYVVGFVATASISHVRPHLARFRVCVGVGGGTKCPNFSDLSIVWALAKLHFERQLKTKAVIIISGDNLFRTLAEVVCHELAVRVMTWAEFEDKEDPGDR